MVALHLVDVARKLQQLGVERDDVGPEVVDDLGVGDALVVLVAAHEQDGVRRERAQEILAVVHGDAVPALVVRREVRGGGRDGYEEQCDRRDPRDEPTARHADPLGDAEAPPCAEAGEDRQGDAREDVEAGDDPLRQLVRRGRHASRP